MGSWGSVVGHNSSSHMMQTRCQDRSLITGRGAQKGRRGGVDKFNPLRGENVSGMLKRG